MKAWLRRHGNRLFLGLMGSYLLYEALQASSGRGRFAGLFFGVMAFTLAMPAPARRWGALGVLLVAVSSFWWWAQNVMMTGLACLVAVGFVYQQWAGTSLLERDRGKEAGW